MIDLVIKLSEEEYDEILNGIENAEIAGVGLSNLSIALKNGTPLPKGHGRLKDVDAVVTRFKETKKFYVDSYGGSFQFMPIEYKVRCDEIDSCWADIVNAPTIIEADKEVE